MGRVGRPRSRADTLAAGVPLTAEEVKAVGLRHEGWSYADIAVKLAEATGRKPRSKDWLWRLCTDDPRALALLQQLSDDDRDAVGRKALRAAIKAHTSEDEAALVLRHEMTRADAKGGTPAMRIAAAQALARIAHNRLARLQPVKAPETDGTLRLVLSTEAGAHLDRLADD